MNWIEWWTKLIFCSAGNVATVAILWCAIGVQQRRIIRRLLAAESEARHWRAAFKSSADRLDTVHAETKAACDLTLTSLRQLQAELEQLTAPADQVN